LTRDELCSSHDVRPARMQRLKTHAWAEVHAIESSVQHHA